MPTKVLDLDLSNRIDSIHNLEGYDSLWILARYRRQPIDWVWIAVPDSGDASVSAARVQQEISRQLGWKLVDSVLGKQFVIDGPKATSEEPISVVVCTRNRPQQLLCCLQSLVKVDYPAFEIIVVDNAPDNEDTFHLASRFPVRYVREDRIGLDWARNRGICEALHGIVAFTDDDARVDSYWLRAVNQSFADPEVMASAGLVGPSELETDAQRLFEWDYGGMAHGLRRRIIKRELITDRELLWASSFGVGVNMAFRKEIFAKVGLFDVALDVGAPSRGAGDVEMFHRIVAKGYASIYNPSMIVWHTHRRRLGALIRQIHDNGRSFGCYLLTCLRNRTVERSVIRKFLLYDWLCKWIIRNLARPRRKLPRYIPLVELAGMVVSPFAYKASQVHARRVAEARSNAGMESRRDG